jgi:hypothetical protein
MCPAAARRQESRRQGILQVATGETYLGEATRSAASFKATMPDVPIAIFTDDPATAREHHCFDMVFEHPHGRRSNADKLAPLKASPFERTLFVDTDTHSIAPCQEVFDLLDRFDLAAAHAPIRANFHIPPDLPASFPELNTGVIAYWNTPGFRSLVDHWLSLLAAQPAEGRGVDQPAFREALYRSGLRYAVLPPEYNLRTCFPFFVGGNAEVKIVHDRGASLDRGIAAVRATPKTVLPRAFDPTADCHTFSERRPS